MFNSVPSSVQHRRCQGTQLDEGRHSQVGSTAAQPSLYPPTPRWPTKWDKASRPWMQRSPTTAPKTRPMDSAMDTWQVSAHMPLAHVPLGTNSDTTNELQR